MAYTVLSVLYLLCNEAFTAVDLTKLRLLDLTCGISRNVRKNKLMRSLVSWKLLAEVIDVLFCAGHTFLYGNYSSSDLAEALIGKTDNSNVLDSRM